MDNEKRKNEALERKRAYNREYHRRPEVKERRRASHAAAVIKYAKAHPERRDMWARQYRATHPDAVAATGALNHGVRSGYVIKPGFCSKCEVCSKCGESKRIEGHHLDYSRPLDVVWLCNSCHKKIHKENKNG